jgi:hypothetical protein
MVAASFDSRDIAESNLALAAALGLEESDLRANETGHVSPRQRAIVAERWGPLWHTVVGTLVGYALIMVVVAVRQVFGPHTPHAAVVAFVGVVIYLVVSARRRPDPDGAVQSVSGPVEHHGHSTTGEDGCDMFIGDTRFVFSRQLQPLIVAAAANGAHCTVYYLKASPVPALLSMKVDGASPW